MAETDELPQAHLSHSFVNLKKLTGLNEGFVLWGGMSPLLKTAIIISSNFCLGYFFCEAEKLYSFIHLQFSFIWRILLQECLIYGGVNLFGPFR
jgi:hypothetical protein